MKYFCAFFLVLGVITVSVKADLLVASGSSEATVLKFDASGNRVTDFSPGWLSESCDGLAVGPGNSIYAVRNTLGLTTIDRLDVTTGAIVASCADGNNDPVHDAGGTYLTMPLSATFGPDGFLYVSSTAFSAPGQKGVTNIFRINPSTWAASQYVTFTGSAPYDIDAIAFGPDHNLYFESWASAPPTSQSEIWKYNTTTKSVSILVSPGTGGLGIGSGMTVGPGGNIFVSSGNSVLEYATNGSFVGTFVASGSGGLNQAGDLKFGPDGNLYIASEGNDEVLRYNGSTGQYIDTYVTAAALSAGGQTYEPWRLAFVPEPTMMLPILLVIPLLRRAPRSAHR